MIVTKSQARGFVDAMLGSHYTNPETGEGDYLSPQVAAYLSGVLPEMVYHYGVTGALLACPRADCVAQRDRFCDFLDAVSKRLREPNGED